MERWNLWIAIAAFVVSITGTVLSPYITGAVQAEQISTLKQEVVDLKIALPKIIQSLSRIEGKLGIND